MRGLRPGAARRSAWLIALSIGLATAPGIAPAADQATVTRALVALTAKDLRVATIGERLAVAALPFCKDRTNRPGLLFQDASQYRGDIRPAAVALYHLRRGPAISALVPGGAAERAGLRVGDRLVALNGESLLDSVRDDRHRADEDRFTQLIGMIEAAFAKGPVRFDIDRDGVPMTIMVTGTPGCASTIQMDLSSALNSGADGHTVTVTQGIVDFTAGDDDALAFVIAHELSHDILGHREEIAAAGGGPGLLGIFGSNVRLVRQTEAQADYYGVYIAARAGYDIDRIPAFWRRMSHHELPGILRDGTHPGDAERIRAIQATIAEIRAQQAKGEPLHPDFARFAAAG